jgi:hypothetical protein
MDYLFLISIQLLIDASRAVQNPLIENEHQQNLSVLRLLDLGKVRRNSKDKRVSNEKDARLSCFLFFREMGFLQFIHLCTSHNQFQ